MKKIALLLLFVVCYSSALTLEQVKTALKENIIPQDSVEMNLRVTVKATGVYQQTDIYMVKKGSDKGYTEIKSSFLKQRSIVNGKKMKVSEIITELNRLGGKHGIGIIDIVENRVVGMKSRGVYETPGGTILYEAHQQLEELILDRDTYALKADLGNKFAQIVYEGKWFTPLREAIQAFIQSTQKYVTGEVKFKLYKGNIIKAGTTSPYSLYNESIASFTTGDLYDHHDAEGFINLFGLSCKVRAMKLQEIEQNK